MTNKIAEFVEVLSDYKTAKKLFENIRHRTIQNKKKVEYKLNKYTLKMCCLF